MSGKCAGKESCHSVGSQIEAHCSRCCSLLTLWDQAERSHMCVRRFHIIVLFVAGYFT